MIIARDDMVVKMAQAGAALKLEFHKPSAFTIIIRNEEVEQFYMWLMYTQGIESSPCSGYIRRSNISLAVAPRQQLSVYHRTLNAPVAALKMPVVAEMAVVLRRMFPLLNNIQINENARVMSFRTS